MAFEPVPKTLAMLQANVDNNGLADRITCVPFALAEERGEVEMWIARGSGQSEIIIANTQRGDTQQLRQQPIGRLQFSQRDWNTCYATLGSARPSPAAPTNFA